MFHHQLVPRISVGQRYSFRTSDAGVGLGIYMKRPFISTCWAVGVPGDSSDESSSSSQINPNGSLFSALDEPSSKTFGTLDAEITAETIDFFVSDAEGDPDCPTAGYSSIEQALNMLRKGKVGSIVWMV